MRKTTGAASPKNEPTPVETVSVPIPEAQKIASGFSSGSAATSTVSTRRPAPPAPVKEQAPAPQAKPAAYLNMTPNEIARHEKRAADASYIKAITLAAEIYEEANVSQRINTKKVEELLAQVTQVYKKYDQSLLLEITQVVRVDKQYYRYHSVNVSLLNFMIGNLLHLTEDECIRLAKVGLLLDIGMMCIPDDILRSRERLNDEQMAVIRQHPDYAVQMLEKAGESDYLLLEGILLHHERYNGSGYPRGLEGEQIPIEARVSAVSDCFDAAVARRGFRQQKSPFDLLAEFSTNSNCELSPDITNRVVEGFARILHGRYITLSDRSVGRVLEVDPDNLAYPVVRVVGRRVQTHEELYPVSLSGYMPLF